MPRTLKASNRDTAGKRFPLNMRTTKIVRDRLEEAANSAGRSLAQEVEYRLQKSFEQDTGDIQLFGGVENAALVQMIGSAIVITERLQGKTWWADPDTREHVKLAITKVVDLLASLNPQPSSPAPTPTDKQRMVAQALINAGRSMVGARVAEQVVGDAVVNFLNKEIERLEALQEKTIS